MSGHMKRKNYEMKDIYLSFFFSWSYVCFFIAMTMAWGLHQEVVETMAQYWEPHFWIVFIWSTSKWNHSAKENHNTTKIMSILQHNANQQNTTLWFQNCNVSLFKRAKLFTVTKISLGTYHTNKQPFTKLKTRVPTWRHTKIITYALSFPSVLSICSI